MRALAGIRATYAVPMSRPVAILIADNGDFSAEIDPGRRLVVKSGEAFVVEERLTGPIVMRLDDFAAVAPSDGRVEIVVEQEPGPPVRYVERGTLDVNGRTGRALYMAGVAPDAPAEEREPVAVIGDDPALAQLGLAMRRLFEAAMLLVRAEIHDDRRALLALFDGGVPLRHGVWTLRSATVLPVPPEAIVLPAEPETRAALAARLADEAREEEAGASIPISRAVFAAGRLWLLAEGMDSIASLAAGETSRTRHEAGGPVLDICASGEAILAVVGPREGGSGWTIRRFEGGTWRDVRSVRRSGDAVLALSCGAAGEMLLTNRRLLDLGRPDGEALRLSERISQGHVTSVLHVTPEAAFLGLNAGEWGGGLRRIDRRSGRVAILERTDSAELCAGPLNTECDPVHAIATVPWRPDCVAAVVGLIHMMATGRIVQVCGDQIEQMFAAIADADPDDPQAAAKALAGGYGSAAFFGLAPLGNALVAVAHDGIYRLAADGTAVHEAWPRFVEVDGLLVSFALPDIVLVVTQINGRASLSGSTPLLVPRSPR